MPFCKPEYYYEAIEYMQNYAKEHNFLFRIDLAVEESMSLIKERYGDKFLYLHNEDFDDYVYTKKISRIFWQEKKIAKEKKSL